MGSVPQEDVQCVWLPFGRYNWFAGPQSSIQWLPGSCGLEGGASAATM